MAGLLDTIQQVLTVVDRLGRLETHQADKAKEFNGEIRSLRSEVRDLDRRLTSLETRFDGLSHLAATEARAAAQSAASLAVAGELRAIGERLARLEGQSAVRLPPA
jgi:hypothetical protein